MPIQQSLFWSSGEVKAQIETAGRYLAASVSMYALGHIRLPGGAARYPRPYVAALLLTTKGPVTSQLIRSFNRSETGSQAHANTRAQLLERLDGKVSLTRDEVARTLGVSPTTVGGWISAGLLPVSKASNGRVSIDTQLLLARCAWVLPH